AFMCINFTIMPHLCMLQIGDFAFLETSETCFAMMKLQTVQDPGTIRKPFRDYGWYVIIAFFNTSPPISSQIGDFTVLETSAMCFAMMKPQLVQDRGPIRKPFRDFVWYMIIAFFTISPPISSQIGDFAFLETSATCFAMMKPQTVQDPGAIRKPFR